MTYRKQYYEENKELFKKSSKKYRQKNLDRYKNLQKKNRQENKDKFLDRVMEQYLSEEKYQEYKNSESL